MQNFKYLALNSDATEAEKYLEESCEYVSCTLHCDVPAIRRICGKDTAELVRRGKGWPLEERSIGALSADQTN